MTGENDQRAAVIAVIDSAISTCGHYIEEHATRRANYGWEFCSSAARVIQLLAEARNALSAEAAR